MANEIRVVPSHPEEARAEIERTRARMSRTIDAIEDVLLRKKEKLKYRLDVVGRARDRPFLSLGVVAGTGLLLGLLTGGRRPRKSRSVSERRAALWEARARRLLEIARRQEERIEHLESTVDRPSSHGRRWIPGGAAWEDPSARLEKLRTSVSGRIDAFANSAVRALVDIARRRG